MNVEFLAEKLFDAACLAQAKRMNPSKPEKHNPREVACEFKNLMEVPKAHYLAMAEYVLNSFVLS